MSALSFRKAIAQFKATLREQRTQKLFQLWLQRVDPIFHCYFLTVFFTGALAPPEDLATAPAGADAGASSGFVFGIIWLITSCCAIMATFEINQYSTSPEDA